MAAGYALVSYIRILNSLNAYKHSVDILEEIYNKTRESIEDERIEITNAMNHVDDMRNICKKIIEHDREVLEHNREVLENNEKIVHNISLLRARLEEMNDQSAT